MERELHYKKLPWDLFRILPVLLLLPVGREPIEREAPPRSLMGPPSPELAVFVKMCVVE